MALSSDTFFHTSTYLECIFDTFATEDGRQAHLSGEIAKALMANADTLLSAPPVIEQLELLAVK